MERDRVQAELERLMETPAPPALVEKVMAFVPLGETAYNMYLAWMVAGFRSGDALRLVGQVLVPMLSEFRQEGGGNAA